MYYRIDSETEFLARNRYVGTVRSIDLYSQLCQLEQVKGTNCNVRRGHWPKILS